MIDSDTRPVTNLSYVTVGLKDSTDTSIREWQYAKLHNGVFESAVLMPSSPNLGKWLLTVESEQVCFFLHIVEKNAFFRSVSGTEI